jgi:hypothetical protein
MCHASADTFEVEADQHGGVEESSRSVVQFEMAGLWLDEDPLIRKVRKYGV